MMNEYMTPQDQIESPMDYSANSIMELAPAISPLDERKKKAEKYEKLASVMKFGADASDPMGVLGAAMMGYAEGGGTWGSIGDDIKGGINKLKGMFGG